MKILRTIGIWVAAILLIIVVPMGWGTALSIAAWVIGWIPGKGELAAGLSIIGLIAAGKFVAEHIQEVTGATFLGRAVSIALLVVASWAAIAFLGWLIIDSPIEDPPRCPPGTPGSGELRTIEHPIGSRLIWLTECVEPTASRPSPR